MNVMLLVLFKKIIIYIIFIILYMLLKKISMICYNLKAINICMICHTSRSQVDTTRPTQVGSILCLFIVIKITFLIK